MFPNPRVKQHHWDGAGFLGIQVGQTTPTRHHVVGKMLGKMAFDGIKRGDFLFSQQLIENKQTKKNPNNLLWCLSGAWGWAGSARVSLAAPSRC